MSLTIDYQLVGTGWAKCTITSGEVNCEVTASYLSDALGNLVLCAVSMLSGITSVSFGFDEEPGEYHWNVRLSGPTEVTLSIVSYYGLWGRPDSEGKPNWAAQPFPSKALELLNEYVTLREGNL